MEPEAGNGDPTGFTVPGLHAERASRWLFFIVGVSGSSFAPQGRRKVEEMHPAQERRPLRQVSQRL